MAKTGKERSLPGDKRNGMTPFIYTPAEFLEDTATQNIETTENGSKLKSKMRILNGDEMLEQLMIWLNDLKEQILKKIVLIEPEKLAILRRFVDMEAQTIMGNIEDN